VRRYADLGGAAKDGLERFAADVRAGTFPGDAESYGE
jgi:ketopantoate hydroxymethyltransferase